MSDKASKEHQDLPFEPPTSKFVPLAVLHKNRSDVFQELDSIPADTVEKFMPVLMNSTYDKPESLEVFHAIKKLKDVPADEFEKAWSDANLPTNRRKFDDFSKNLPLSQVSELHELLRGYKQVTQPQYDSSKLYRHSLSPKFITNLFQTPNAEKAQEEFPKIPLERRTKWFDLASHFVAIKYLEPEALAMRQCLIGHHKPGAPFFKDMPCRGVGLALLNGLDHFRDAQSAVGPCGDLTDSLRVHMVTEPNFELAKSNFSLLDVCHAKVNRDVNIMVDVSRSRSIFE